MQQLTYLYALYSWLATFVVSFKKTLDFVTNT